MPQPAAPLLKLPAPTKGHWRRRFFSLAERPLSRLLCLPRLNAIYSQMADDEKGDPWAFIPATLRALGVDYHVPESDLAQIPKNGAVITVANHPFGAIEGLILADLLHKVRPDVKLMANYLLALIPEMSEVIISVDPFGAGSAAKRNVGPLKNSLAWLKEGHMLGVFPAGEVSSVQIGNRAVMDPEWSPTIARIAKRTKTPVLPIYFKGTNTVLFHLLGLLNPRLRTVMLPREMLNKKNTTVQVSIGSLIPAKRIERFETDEKLTDYLRMRTYALRHRYPRKRIFFRAGSASQNLPPVAEPTPQDELQAEVQALPSENILVLTEEYMVFHTNQERTPHCVSEIGRLREVCFREVGEGTGNPRDLDRFDATYNHLILWHRGNDEIAGAYRIGHTDELMEAGGPAALYTYSLFEFNDSFLSAINPALELGRAFIQSKYQRSYFGLMLLWKGIGAYVLKHPKYHVLFGPVSISDAYKPFSRELLSRFLMKHHGVDESELKRSVKGRTPPKFKRFHSRNVNAKTLSETFEDLDDVNTTIATVEGDGKGVPVLIRQYLKLGGRILAFNVDHDFGDAMDGLMLVDLTKTDTRILARYMGEDQAREFLLYHQTAKNPGNGILPVEAARQEAG